MTFRTLLTLTLSFVLVLSLTACGMGAPTVDPAGDTAATTAADAATTPPTAADAATATPDNLLTPEEAQAIALEDAGLSADAVPYIDVDYDLDDGVPEYNVEFFHDGTEYDYEIHAETGAIRSREKDRDR